MISVVIPLYNKERAIRHTLETVLGQTYQNFEIVIVNDGSTDNSVSEAQKVNDPRIRIINQKNAGVSAARNRGIEEAKYDLIAFLDADDEWKPTYLETQMALAEKYPQCNVFATNYEFRDSEGNVRPTIIRRLPFDGEDGVLTNYFEVASHSHPPICSITIMVRKTAIQDVGGFPVGIAAGEDLLTWAQLATRNEIAYSKKPLAAFIIDTFAFNTKPRRRPADVDIVAQELNALKEAFPHTKGLKTYISHWHKMRCAIYYQLGEKKNSIREALKALKYNVFNYKLYAYILMNIIPLKKTQ